jgi:hypothetical protein
MIETFEPFLMAGQLREALISKVPAVTGETNFAKLLPLLPYMTLLGGKRKLYRVSTVLAALEKLAVLVEPPIPGPVESPLHRRRPRRRAS